MLAVEMTGDGEVRVAERPIPQAGPRQVLIRSDVVGICHSDVELQHGSFITPVAFPMIPGHEWVGTVVEIGDDVSEVAVGDRVVGECRVGANDYFGLNLDGAASEYFLARGDWLHRIPATLPSAIGALVEPFTVAYYAASVHGAVESGSTAVVLGAGAIGLCATALLAALGASVVVVDPVESRRMLARRLGAATTLEPGAALPDAVRDLTSGRGADLVIEASGSSDALASALQIVRQFGRVTFAGFNIGHQVSSELGLIQSKDLAVRGITGSPGVWPDAIRFLDERDVDLAPVVTATLSVVEAPAAYAAAVDGAHVKVQLRMSEPELGRQGVPHAA